MVIAGVVAVVVLAGVLVAVVVRRRSDAPSHLPSGGENAGPSAGFGHYDNTTAP